MAARSMPQPSKSVRARLMGLGGQRADGTPDVSAIATRVDRSERTVRRWLSEDRLPAAAAGQVRDLERAEARKPRWIQVRDEGPTSRALLGARATQAPAAQDVHGSLLAAFRRPDGSLDSRRAAAELGVHQRTVQRWAKGETRPTLEHQKALRAKVRQSIVTSGKRAARMANQGARVQVTAQVSVSADTRVRTLGQYTGIQLSGDDMSKITAAYAAGGDRAANKALARAVAASRYGRSANLSADSISRISEVSFLR